MLPAKRSVAKPASEPYRRLSTQEVEKKIERIRRGTFKVYVGAAPGAGKTYMMLREGNALLRKDIDVVIGCVDTHGRSDTEAQIGGLTAIPADSDRVERYDGRRDGCLGDYRPKPRGRLDRRAGARERARQPQQAPVRGHTSNLGCGHFRHFHDERAASGESKDAVEQITCTTVTETVPDQFLRLADEMELVDVAPSALQQRLRDGLIYKDEDVDAALAGFFKTGNLIALRELALREIADDVDERLESWERNGSLRGTWHRHESIFVAVTTSKNAERLIRRGFRIAYRLKADWHVHYIHAEGDRSEVCNRRIEEIKALVDRLGGNFEAESGVSASKIPDALLKKANELQEHANDPGPVRPRVLEQAEDQTGHRYDSARRPAYGRAGRGGF